MADTYQVSSKLTHKTPLEKAVFLYLKDITMYRFRDQQVPQV